MNNFTGRHIRRAIIFSGVLTSIGVPFFSSAAVSYSRSLSGALITSPVSISLSFSDIADFGWSNAAYYRIIVNGFNFYDVSGACRPVNEKSIVEKINLPGGLQSDVIWIGAFTDNNCEIVASPDQNYDLETAGGNEIIFSVQSPSGVVGVPANILAHRPEVSIKFPREGDFAGGATAIQYAASDEDNAIHPPFGFGEKPISIYYSDERNPADDGWLRIAEDIANAGEYQWNAAGLPDGEYFLKITARDQSGERDEDIAGPFEMDTIPPVFNVSAEPSVSKGESVKIIVAASEPLGAAPAVTVRQRDFTDIEVLMRGDGAKWEGVYEVRPNFDGTAQVRVSGKDRAGNKGEIIASGGRFSVGIEPPPKPVIVLPLDGEAMSAGKASIRGSIREDTEAVLTINGTTTEYRMAPDEKGGFVFENIILDPEFNKGENILAVASRDRAGNTSDAVAIRVKFNLSPEIRILAPAGGVALYGTTTIRIEAADKNRDRLLFTYAIGRDASTTISVIAEAAQSKRQVWDTTALPDGEYVLQVEADDGLAKTRVFSEPFTIRNLLPVFSFADGERSVTGRKEAQIRGTARIPDGAAGARLASIEYSIDNGARWLTIIPVDGAADAASEEFSIYLADLEEKSRSILFRAMDTRGRIGRGEKVLIVDFGPPAAPAVLSPSQNDAISDGDDAMPDRAGVQIAVSGRAEPASDIKIIRGADEFSARANPDGSFVIPGVRLGRHGENIFEIFATDAAGNRSPAAKLAVRYNNPPAIRFINPRPDRGLHGRAEIEWEASDPDGDPVMPATLSYRKGGGDFRPLVSNAKIQSYIWNVGALPESADYELRLETNDGVTPAERTIHIFIDNTSPEINVAPLAKTVFRTAFTLGASGIARDDFSGIEYVEYAVEPAGSKARHWFKALVTSGFLERRAAFRIAHRAAFEDGEYELRIRSADRAGNVSPEQISRIIVDATPPRIGSYTLGYGPLLLFPEGDALKAVEGSELAFKMSLEADTASAAILIGDQARPLAKNSEGLWEATLSFPDAGRFALAASAADRVGNAAGPVRIGEILILPRGKITDENSGDPVGGVAVTAEIFNAGDQSYKRWRGDEYSLANPVATDERGQYELFLPPGQYRLLVQKSGFARVRSSPFVLSDPRFIQSDFSLRRRAGIRGLFEDVVDRLNPIR